MQIEGAYSHNDKAMIVSVLFDLANLTTIKALKIQDFLLPLRSKVEGQRSKAYSG